jgi:hypothetical protein
MAKLQVEGHLTLLNDIAAKALAVRDIAREKPSAISQIYQVFTAACKTFRGVLNDAALEAQNQQRWTDLVVGVICGTAAGLLAAFVMPSTAAGWFSLTSAKVGTAASLSTGQEVRNCSAVCGHWCGRSGCIRRPRIGVQRGSDAGVGEVSGLDRWCGVGVSSQDQPDLEAQAACGDMVCWTGPWGDRGRVLARARMIWCATTSMCAGLYGRRGARDRAIRVVTATQRDSVGEVPV